jgi:poly-gamma-glutamate capsule biosynthesis protein CapA/YwtB (metallophosphatase superfamily)
MMMYSNTGIVSRLQSNMAKALNLQNNVGRTLKSKRNSDIEKRQEKKLMTRIIVGSDICPTSHDEAAFIAGDKHALLNDLEDIFSAADLRIVNLECPLTDSHSPIFKSGPAMRAPADCVNGLKAMGIDVAGLANNHILDHGAEGLRNTMAVCKAAGIKVVGAGNNLAEAVSWLSLDVNDLKIGIVAMAEQEWSIATERNAGASPIDLIRFTREIRERRSQYDFILIIFHGGNEHYFYPSPWLQEVCRFLIEQGADAVICQHTHCPGCMERYQNGHIVYGQGNMIFHWDGRSEFWYQGFLVTLLANKNQPLEIEYTAYRQSCDHIGIKRMDSQQEAAFLRELADRSELIMQPGYVQQAWTEFCKERRDYYLNAVAALNANRRESEKLDKQQFSDHALMALTNIIRCESHHAALLEALGQEVCKRGLSVFCEKAEQL